MLMRLYLGAKSPHVFVVVTAMYGMPGVERGCRAYNQADSGGTGMLLILAGGVFILLAIGVGLYAKRRRADSPVSEAAAVPESAPGAKTVPSPSRAPYLEAIDGSMELQLEGLEKEPLIIGSGEGAHVLLDMQGVEPVHARFYLHPVTGQVVVEDLGSATGIYVNDMRAPRKNFLKDGWKLTLGVVSFRVRVPGQERRAER